jgi:DNA-binding IscR family transcriptional regulator
MSREARRRRGKRQARREALAAITQMASLSEQGFSSSAIAATLPVDSQCVSTVLQMLKEAGAPAHLLEAQKESVGEGVGGA